MSGLTNSNHCRKQKENLAETKILFGFGDPCDVHGLGSKAVP